MLHYITQNIVDKMYEKKVNLCENVIHQIENGKFRISIWVFNISFHGITVCCSPVYVFSSKERRVHSHSVLIHLNEPIKRIWNHIFSRKQISNVNSMKRWWDDDDDDELPLMVEGCQMIWFTIGVANHIQNIVYSRAFHIVSGHSKAVQSEQNPIHSDSE